VKKRKKKKREKKERRAWEKGKVGKEKPTPKNQKPPGELELAGFPPSLRVGRPQAQPLGS